MVCTARAAVLRAKAATSTAGIRRSALNILVCSFIIFSSDSVDSALVVEGQGRCVLQSRAAGPIFGDFTVSAQMSASDRTPSDEGMTVINPKTNRAGQRQDR